MDFTPLIPRVRSHAAEAADLLQDARVVVCLGSRLLLSCFLYSTVCPEQILAAVTTEAEGLERVRRHRPDVLLVSDRLEQGCGLELVLAAKQLDPAIRTLLLLGDRPAPQRLRAVVEAGCDGLCLEERMGLGSGVAAVRAICSGGLYTDRGVRELLTAGPGGAAVAGPDLSEREGQVLQLMAQGLSNQAIAAQLMIGVATVKTHVSHLLEKLGARQRAQAVALAVHWGLVALGEPEADAWPAPMVKTGRGR